MTEHLNQHTLQDISSQLDNPNNNVQVCIRFNNKLAGYNHDGLPLL